MIKLPQIPALLPALLALALCAVRSSAQTIVWSENFDDGNGNNRWFADNGVWDFGSPTKADGPATNSLGFQTHSGSFCAVTVLAGDYPANANSRLIRIQSFVVPAANQFPRLRFWHWYATQIGPDYGEVQVKGTNGWQSISPHYTGLSGGWTYASLDLSAFAGQTIQVGFHFVSDGPGFEGAGWYVDDIALITGAPVFNNPEGFEGGIGDWSVDGGTWQVGTPTKSDGPQTNSLGFRAHTGSNCAVTVLGADYPSSVNTRLVSPAFVVPQTNQYPRLRFWHWYSTQFGPDYGEVQVRIGTNAWQSVSSQYTGLSGGWTYASIDLSAYAGQTIQVGFHFVSDGPGFEGAGWYVDDIALITGAPVFNNPEGFEGGMGDWSVDGGTWQVGTPTKSDGAQTNSLGFRAHTGSNCAATLLNSDYPYQINTRLISPPFAVPPASASPNLRFWHWWATQNGPDYGEVQVRVGTGAWQSVTGHYTGSSGNWTQPFVDLSPYGGQTIQLAFHFVSDGPGTEGAGWFVDDISVQSFGVPVIITPPAGQTNAVGTGATFNVSASGDLPLSYQWRFNSNSIPNATNSSLTLTNVQLTDTGYFDVVVTNSSGSITSTPEAFLQVRIAFATNDIGSPGAAGGLTNFNGLYTIQGSGEGTDGSADVFCLLALPLSGDAEVIARFQSMTGGDPQLAETGVMIRESLDPGSKQVSLTVNAATNTLFRRRAALDALSVQNVFRGTNYLHGTNYLWLRLMRMGNTFVAHTSTNGFNWQYTWFTTLQMSNQVLAGLTITAHHHGQLATAVCDNVSIGSPTPVPGTWPLSGPQIHLGGEPTAIPLNSLGGFKMLIGGPVGDFYNILASSNAAAHSATWSVVGSVTNQWGVVDFLDAGALTNGTRFYRAKKVGP